MKAKKMLYECMLLVYPTVIAVLSWSQEVSVKFDGNMYFVQIVGKIYRLLYRLNCSGRVGINWSPGCPSLQERYRFFLLNKFRQSKIQQFPAAKVMQIIQREWERQKGWETSRKLHKRSGLNIIKFRFGKSIVLLLLLFQFLNCFFLNCFLIVF